MKQINEKLKKIADEIVSHSSVLIICHIRPDGDTLASAYALKSIIEQKGGKASCVCSDPVSERLSFLCDSPLYLPESLPKDFDYDLAVTVDVAAKTMLGKCAPLLKKCRSIKIDHHISDDTFADVNYSEENTAAASEIIFDIAVYLDCMTFHVCELLYAGISFDTGCFKHSNVTESTHLKAAYLVSRKVDSNKINRLLFDERTKSETDALKVTYNGLRYFRDGKIALVCIDNKIKAENGPSDDDLSDTSQIPIEIKGVRLGITIKEKSDEPGVFKISMRSVPGVDASAICRRLGGGGHLCAAGGSVKASSREEAISKTLAEVGDDL